MTKLITGTLVLAFASLVSAAQQTPPATPAPADQQTAKTGKGTHGKDKNGGGKRSKQKGTQTPGSPTTK
jgi:hypothetical protein